ncbi:ADP-ribosylglycohydrolase family protein [Paenibacillus plantarum]|nr:ADP-ribosylglycohydrolase family protein [Paenibacillus plantarum]
MLLSLPFLKDQISTILRNKFAQGNDTSGYLHRLESLPTSYDAYFSFAQSLAQMPLRQDWPYYEPDTIEEIWNECDPTRPLGMLRAVNFEENSRRLETAFLSSVCGSMLGKPLEVNPNLYEMREAFSKVGEWPLRDYISDEMLRALGRRHWSWFETARDRIHYVAPDDDINYTLVGMLAVEQFGTAFTQLDLRNLWLNHLPISTTWGPERVMLLRSGLSYLEHDKSPIPLEEIGRWADVLTPDSELCGAAIRADAYGYACPGNPALAAELAWRDASFTHRRTGVYATMFLAAAIAAAQVLDDRVAVIDTALQFVPQRSRFYESASTCRDIVIKAGDWLEAYDAIHTRYGEFQHCGIHQEIGTLINTFLFAENVGDGICKQVAQGNDTDSFGASVGSLLGAWFGPDGFDHERWTAPFQDTIRTGLAYFYEQSLSQLAARIGRLPRIVSERSHKIVPSELYNQENNA